ncbi:MAG: acyl-CoA desaturase, partial [Actinomycetota bacterium]
MTLAPPERTGGAARRDGHAVPVGPIPRLATEPMAPGMRTTIAIFVAVPLAAVVLAIPVAWGGWLGWTDVILAAVFYLIAAGGITVGFHRHFTHGSFK